jgi:hypothetical protein
MGCGKRCRTNRAQRRYIVRSGGHMVIELKIRAKIKPASRVTIFAFPRFARPNTENNHRAQR